MDYINDITIGFNALLNGYTGSDDDIKELYNLMRDCMIYFKNDNREYFEKGYKMPPDITILKYTMREWQVEYEPCFSHMDIDKGRYTISDSLFLMCEAWHRMIDGYYPNNTNQATEHNQAEQAAEPQHDKIIMEQQKTMNTPSNRGRGRQKESFADKMIDGNKEKLDNIHKLMNGKKGKDAALIISACIIKGWITKPTYTQVKEEFGDIGTQQGFTKYLNNANTLYAPEEIGAILEQLKE